jgi:hypothetical protein
MARVARIQINRAEKAKKVQARKIRQILRNVWQRNSMSETERLKETVRVIALVPIVMMK